MKKMLLLLATCIATACSSSLPTLKYPNGKDKIPVNANTGAMPIK